MRSVENRVIYVKKLLRFNFVKPQQIYYSNAAKEIIFGDT